MTTLGNEREMRTKIGDYSAVVVDLCKNNYVNIGHNFLLLGLYTKISNSVKFEIQK